MKERPILFSAPMVRALLEGRKTQTRRVVKLKGDAPKTIFPLLGKDNAPTGEWFFSDPVYDRVGRSGHFCPYGKPGDRLWVRESFQPLLADDLSRYSMDYKTGKGYKVNYVATDGIQEFLDLKTDSAFCSRVTPSIFMPRWASRITLEITEVRVQRMQEISHADCIAEGISAVSMFDLDCSSTPPRDDYRSLWESINGAGSWNANPWVWAVRFKVVRA